MISETSHGKIYRERLGVQKKPEETHSLMAYIVCLLGHILSAQDVSKENPFLNVVYLVLSGLAMDQWLLVSPN